MVRNGSLEAPLIGKKDEDPSQLQRPVFYIVGFLVVSLIVAGEGHLVEESAFEATKCSTTWCKVHGYGEDTCHCGVCGSYGGCSWTCQPNSTEMKEYALLPCRSATGRNIADVIFVIILALLVMVMTVIIYEKARERIKARRIALATRVEDTENGGKTDEKESACNESETSDAVSTRAPSSVLTRPSSLLAGVEAEDAENVAAVKIICDEVEAVGADASVHGVCLNAGDGSSATTLKKAGKDVEPSAADINGVSAVSMKAERILVPAPSEDAQHAGKASETKKACDEAEASDAGVDRVPASLVSLQVAESAAEKAPDMKKNCDEVEASEAEASGVGVGVPAVYLKAPSIEPSTGLRAGGNDSSTDAIDESYEDEFSAVLMKAKRILASAALEDAGHAKKADEVQEVCDETVEDAGHARKANEIEKACDETEVSGVSASPVLGSVASLDKENAENGVELKRTCSKEVSCEEVGVPAVRLKAKMFDALAKLEVARDGSSVAAMEKACQDVEASGADLSGVSAVRNQAKRIQGLAKLEDAEHPDHADEIEPEPEADSSEMGSFCNEVEASGAIASRRTAALTRLNLAARGGNADAMEKACDEVEASGADISGVPAVRKEARKIRALKRLETAEHGRDADEIDKACNEVEASGADPCRVPVLRLKARKLRVFARTQSQLKENEKILSEALLGD